MSTDLHDDVTELFSFNAALDNTEDLPATPDRDVECLSRDLDLTELLGRGQEAETSLASEKTLESLQIEGRRPQAMLTFEMGHHRFSDSVELGVLNEHPEALKAITTTQSLTSSAFLEPAIQAAMTELRPSLMNQMAVQLTIICLHLVAEVLSTEDNQATAEGSAEYRKLAGVVQCELAKALPYFEWQARTNHFGRARYLMALLEEALRMLRTEEKSVMEGLQSHVSAKSALQGVTQAIANSGYSSAEVCGEWAAQTLLTAWPLKAAKSRKHHRDSTVFCSSFLPEDKQGEDRFFQSPTTSEDNGDDDELPPLSSFVRRKPSERASATLAQSGNSEDDPIWVSDPEADRNYDNAKRRSKKSGAETAGISCPSEARKAVGYNKKRHPQDEDIPCVRKKRKVPASS